MFFSPPSWSFPHLSTHSSVRRSPSNPYSLYFIHPFLPAVHTSSPGSLRQEVLQLQLSTKASVKGNSLTPDLSLVSDSRLVQELPNLTTVHAVPQQPLSCYTHRVAFASVLKSLNSSSLIHYLRRASYCVGWLANWFCSTAAPKSLYCLSLFTPRACQAWTPSANLHAEVDGCLKDEHHRTSRLEVYPHPTCSLTTGC